MTAMGSARARDTVRRLEAAVRSGRWPIDTKIPTEAELAAELGVGRSTVREAVRSLAHLGMLEPAPGRGTFVRSLNPVSGVLTDFAAEHSWSDILEVRSALETRAAALAAQHRDPAGVARLQSALDLDTPELAAPPSGTVRAPGQFHAVLIDLAGNRLLAELHAGLLGALRRGLAAGDVRRLQSDDDRRAEHAALLAAIAAGNPTAAAAIAAAHAGHDLCTHD